MRCLRRAVLLQLASRCRGLSLVELLVAMALGMLLSAGMVSLFLESRRQYFYDEQLSRLQENGRYAINLLSRELAMAGFFATVLDRKTLATQPVSRDCSDLNWALNPVTAVDMVNDHLPSSVAMDTVQGALLNCVDGRAVVALSDALIIKRVAGRASLREGEIASNLTPSSTLQWYLRVEEGVAPRWQKLAAGDLSALALSGDSASYWEAITHIFYIRDYSDAENPADQLPTLCMEGLVNDLMSTRCLVEGVENLQIELGLDTDGDGIANRYAGAPLAHEVALAVSVRVSLLLRSTQSLAGYRDDKDYRVGPLSIAAPQDAFLRRVFTTTVQLRNVLRPVADQGKI